MNGDGDVAVNNATGRPNTLTGTNKVTQDLQEFFTVNITVNGFGAGIDSMLGMVPVDGASFVGLIDSRVRAGIAQFRSMQHSDTRIQYTQDELVLSLAKLVVAQTPNDDTAYYFTASILTESGLIFNIPISIPQ